MLVCSQLEKNYRGRKVVQDLSFRVNKGEVFALLGSNGAGKTTTPNPYTALQTARPRAGIDIVTFRPIEESRNRTTGIRYKRTQEWNIYRSHVQKEGRRAALYAVFLPCASCCII